MLLPWILRTRVGSTRDALLSVVVFVACQARQVTAESAESTSSSGGSDGATGPASTTGSGTSITTSAAETSASTIGPADCGDAPIAAETTLWEVTAHATTLVHASYPDAILSDVFAGPMETDGTISIPAMPNGRLDGAWIVEFDSVSAESGVDVRYSADACPTIVPTGIVPLFDVGFDITLVPDSPQLVELYLADPNCGPLAGVRLAVLGFLAPEIDVQLFGPRVDPGIPTWTMHIAADGSQTIDGC